MPQRLYGQAAAGVDRCGQDVAVCRRLLRVLARRPAQELALKAEGFAVEGSVPSLIRGAEIVFSSVSDDQALSEVMLNAAFRDALSPNAIVIDMSTVSPSVSAAIAAHLEGIAYMRAPVSGSTAMAEAGTLTALVSGPRPAFDALAPIFAAFTKQAFYLGSAEEARFLKLAVNSMVAATAVLLGEALAFGRQGGLSDQAMLEVITQSAVASPLIGYKKNMIVSGDYTAAATLDMLKKDVDLFLASGTEMGLALPAGHLVQQHYHAASQSGLGSSDFFVLVREAEHTTT